MSASQEAIDERLDQLQIAVNARDVGVEFELKELFEENDWRQSVFERNLDKSVTRCFKKRICGWPGSVEPVLINVQVGDVRTNGRERMFTRIEGHHRPEG